MRHGLLLSGLCGTLVLGLAHNLCAQNKARFNSPWKTSVDRVWLGPEYYANRLQDWRLQGGRLECVEGAPNFPVRTVHLLPAAFGAGTGTMEMEVRSGPIQSSGPMQEGAFRGFLIGVGGPHVDYRLSAQVHHRPAEDGGLLAIVDANGRVSLRDFSTGSTAQPSWSVGGKLDLQDIPEFSPEERQDPGPPENWNGAVRLVMELQSTITGHRLKLTAYDDLSKKLISSLTWSAVPDSFTDGGLALVSHLGDQETRQGFWFRQWEGMGGKLRFDPLLMYGPVLATQYTLHKNTLRLTAQMGPLGKDDSQKARLAIQPHDWNGNWKAAADAELVAGSYTFTFEVPDWDHRHDTPFRIEYDLKDANGDIRVLFYDGLIRKEPLEKEELVIAAFTGHKIYTGGLKWNSGGLWFPHAELVAAVKSQSPDFLFFSGDQVYEGDLTPAERRSVEKSNLDYLYKWYRWCWAFEDLIRTTPSVCIPDDHDVYHGNIWGAGGKKAVGKEGLRAQDAGGYKMDPWFVNNVHRTQTSHLPPPFDPAPIEQGISVYYTEVNYGGISFAVVADRMFKSSPTIMVPEGKVVNGWFQNEDFDPVRNADVPGAVLLGQRQLDFLNHWAVDWSDQTWMKVVLSQTIFANVATLPETAKSDSVVPRLPHLPAMEYPENDKKAADADSNGWPQTGRNKALRAMRKGFAFHIAGDQHLGSTIQYGVDAFRDSGFALCVPSVANTFPRRWYPPEGGLNREPQAPKYTGDFLDGFGNRLTVRAVSNPIQSNREPRNLYDRAPGYGIVRFNRKTRTAQMECWPRWIDPQKQDAAQYPGWPIQAHQLENYHGSNVHYLPEIEVEEVTDQVLEVREQISGDILYAIRMSGSVFLPKVFRAGTYAVRVGDPDTGRWTEIRDLQSSTEANRKGLKVSLR